MRCCAASLAAALGLALAAPAAAAGECAIEAGDARWLEAALADWRQAEVEWLALEARPVPTIVAIDGACTYVLPEGSLAAAEGAPHGEAAAALPGGGEVPLGPVAFASGEGGYFVMSLPSLWRAAGVDSEAGLEVLMTGVLLHEMMHMRQFALADAALAGQAEALGIDPEALSDNIVQDRFKENPDYVAAFDAERSALFAAAAAPDDAAARALAGEALAMMRARRERWFTGKEVALARLDDVFLTMEGMGQWLLYRHFLASGVAPDEVLAAVRRGGGQWSQDEGLALILVVDRLLPHWQSRAFREPDWRAANLLAAAIEAH